MQKVCEKEVRRSLHDLQCVEAACRIWGVKGGLHDLRREKGGGPCKKSGVGVVVGRRGLCGAEGPSK